jgi:phenylphosphate carboxylase gamma subunit
MRKEYDTFILKELPEVIDDEESELTIRDLTPGTHKYKQMSVRAMLSRDADKYPDTLWVRLGKGQLLAKPWSIKIINRLNNVTKKYL